MIAENSPAAESQVSPSHAAVGPAQPDGAEPETRENVLDGILSVFAILFGIVVGTIVAYIAALFLGWARFC
jgi:hypothetical protein